VDAGAELLVENDALEFWLDSLATDVAIDGAPNFAPGNASNPAEKESAG
jgi:hypothetical protein